MIPILHTQKYAGGIETTIGRLSDCIRCEVIERLNGEYELELEYPLSGLHATDLACGRVIVAKPSYQTSWQTYLHNQPFRIYEISDDEEHVRHVYAHHISYDLNRALIYQFSATGVHNTLSYIEQNMIRRSSDTLPWEFDSDLTYSPIEFSVNHPVTIRELLGGMEGSVLDTFGGEFEWDEFKVRLLKRRSYGDCVVRYGVNLTRFEREETDENAYTHVMVYWYQPDTNQLQVSSAQPVSDISQVSLVQSRTQLIDITDQYEEKPTKAELDTLAQSYASGTSALPEVGIDVEIANLQAAGEETPLTKGINLGDTVEIHYEPLNIVTTQKVIETTWDVIQNRYTSVRVGTLQASLADTIASDSAASGGGGGGTGNYEQLNNLPSINGTTIIGALSLADIGAASIAALNNKVDKVDGKGLSTNDFTDAYKTKLDGIATGAEVNVQADWNVTDSSSDAYIKNKPSWTIDSALSTTSENPVQNKVITNALDTKLEGVTVNGVAQTVTNHIAEISAVTEFEVNDVSAVGSNGHAEISFNGATVTGGAGNVVITIDEQSHKEWTNPMLGQTYAVCNVANATTPKHISGLPSSALTKVGGIVAVLFTYGLAANDTISFGDPGDTEHIYPVYINNRAIRAGEAPNGTLATMIFDGSHYHVIALRGQSFGDLQFAGEPGSRYFKTTDGTNTFIPILKIGVNGTTQTNTNGTVDLAVPDMSYVALGDVAAMQITEGNLTLNAPVLDSTTGLMSPAYLPTASSSVKGVVNVDTALSSSSANPVQNSVINTALDGKVPTSRTVNGHALTANVTITASDLGLGNVENKSSATIRSEITDSDLTGHANAIAKAETRYVGQATFNSAIPTVTTNTLIRKGNVVQCELRWTTPSTQTSSQPVCTIPSGFRPTTRMYANALKAAWTITNGTCPVVFQTSGAVTHINTAFTTSTSYVVCMTWLTDNDYPS